MFKKLFGERNSLIFYLLILIIGAGFIVGSVILNTGKSEREQLTQIMPDSKETREDGTRIYSFTISTDEENRDLVFFSSHHFIHVYGDGQAIYERANNGGIWGHTTGNAWNFVNVPTNVQTVTVESTPAYHIVEDQNFVFYFGDEMDIFMNIFVDSLTSLFISGLIVVAGLCMLIYWLIVHRSVSVGRSMLYLSVFAMILGIWSANETSTACLIFQGRIASQYMAFVLLMLLGIPFALFVKEFLEINDKIFWKILCFACGIEFAASEILQVTNIADFRETLIVTHILLVAALTYIAGCLVYKFKHHQVNRRVWISVVGGVLVLFATVLDLFHYYSSVGDSDLLGRFAFLLFIAVLGLESAGQARFAIERGRRAEEMEIFALTDDMTKLYNRNAYNRFIENMPSFQNRMIIVFDLNDLKRCNDEFGHKIGDEYICKSADMVESIFGNHGRCYRIGGDEFCCIVDKADACPIDRLLMRLQTMTQNFNHKGLLPVEIHIASGYATCENGDLNFEMIRDRADRRMYENKKEIKSNQSK